MKNWYWQKLIFIFGFSGSLCLLAFSGVEARQSTATFDNQSGEMALVKLVGPSPAQISILNLEQQTVPVSPGR